MADSSLPQGDRGAALLIEHCTALTRVADERAPAFTRLEEAVGGELARLLVGALAGRRGHRAAALIPV
jgi:hypothetical protein